MRKTGSCLTALMLLGCGDKEDAGSPGIPIGSAPAEIAKTVCPKAYSCCMTEQLMGNDLAGTDEPSCEVKTTEGFTKNLNVVRDSQTKGRSVYRGDKVAACLVFIRQASCATLNTTSRLRGVKGCESFTDPKLAPGATCTFDWECIDGECSKPPMAAEGICRPLAKEGESCVAVGCSGDLVCHGETKKCVALLPEGSLCTKHEQCRSFSCTSQVGANGVCSKTPAADQCFYSSACSYGRAPASALALLFAAALAVALVRRRVAGRSR